MQEYFTICFPFGMICPLLTISMKQIQQTKHCKRFQQKLNYSEQLLCYCHFLSVTRSATVGRLCERMSEVWNGLASQVNVSVELAMCRLRMLGLIWVIWSSSNASMLVHEKWIILAILRYVQKIVQNYCKSQKLLHTVVQRFGYETKVTDTHLVPLFPPAKFPVQFLLSPPTPSLSALIWQLSLFHHMRK